MTADSDNAASPRDEREPSASGAGVRRTTVRIGTRASDLALWQARHVGGLLEQAGDAEGIDVSVEIVEISTQGDRVLDRQLKEIGGKGLFVREIERALLDSSVDVAVHSLKDLPVEQPEGLTLDAYPARGAAFDVLCCREDGATLASLRDGARIGTGSLRRGAQLLRLRPDLEVIPIRGNVTTRLSKRAPEQLDLDAVVLAEAGLRRLGIWEGGFSVLSPPDYLPAPGQGALAVQTRTADDNTRALVKQLDDEATRLQILAERAALAAIEGDCHTPFAAYGELTADGIRLHARLLEEDGRSTEGARMVVFGDEPRAQAETLGHTLGTNLLARRAEATQR